MLSLTQRRTSYENVCLLIFVLLMPAVADEDFLGGTITYNMEERAGKKFAHIELTTGWVLGQGRCGPVCDEHSLNTIITNNGNLFGSFSRKNFYGHKHNESTINDVVQANAVERVIVLNTNNNWEQDKLTFEIDLDSTTEVVAQVEGKNWMSDIRGGALQWMLQAKMTTEVRTDTNQTNRCPVVHIKPIYHVRLNTESKIKLTVNDADDDIVKCELASSSIAGKVADNVGVGIDVDKETCTITLNASSVNGYKDKDMVAIPLKIMDYNKLPMKLGRYSRNPNSNYLGYSSVQFIVQVSEHLETPYFVSPTVEQSHVYILYIGATWEAKMYATSTAESTVAKMIPYGYKNETFTVSELKNSGNNAKFAVIKWKPDMSAKGGHVICVNAEDDKGVEAEEHRCIKINVKENSYKYSTEAGNKRPSFVNFPSSNQLVNCSIGITCLLPVYIKSSSAIHNVTTTKSFVNEARFGQVETRSQGTNVVYVVTLAFSHPTFGKNMICMKAYDVIGTSSDEACINTFIEPPDPCLSHPCKNAGKCKSNKIEGTFVCQCLASSEGKFCENRKHFCDPNPCKHGTCRDFHIRFYCKCIAGFTGNTCETNIDDCTEGSCHKNGICKDDVNKFECDCFDRYNGDNCSHDICAKLNLPRDILSCPEDGCYPDPCTGHGVCLSGGECTCLMGYNTDRNCSEAIGDLNVTGVEFIQPSPMNRSMVICSTQPNVSCKMTLFVSQESSSVPTVSIVSTTEQLQSSITIQQPSISQFIEGITNIYTVEVTIPTQLEDKEQQYACFMAMSGGYKTTACYEFKFITQSSGTIVTTDAHFMAPTPTEGTTVKCFENERCMMLLFTSPANQTCLDAVSSTPGVKVLQTNLMSTLCVTEVMFKYASAGSKQLYFQSSKENYELRKFQLEVLTKDSDPCDRFPCQNGGHCFPDNGGGYHCICEKSYVGNYCEKGPCPTNKCMNNAYCQISNGTEVCICTAGFQGDKCESSISQPGNKMNFTGIALPQTFTCVVYQPCSFPLITTSSSVSYGYVSYVLQLDPIEITKLMDSENYLVSVRLISKKEGVQDVCLQTVDTNMVNKDELCAKVKTVTDMSSLYGEKNLPHFIKPSLPTDTEVECVEGESCHIIYRVAHGDSNINEKMDFSPSTDLGFDTYYIYTDCQSGVDASSGGNCTVDISIITDSKDVGVSRRFCIQASITRTGENGEERCFNLNVVGSSSTVPTGCQSLECHNGGFCDGHVPSNPICFCRRGFEGNDCKQAVSPEAVFRGMVQTPFYVGQLGIPAEIQCLVKRPCVIPFQIVASPDQTQAPDIFLGYVDPSVTVSQPSVNEGSKSNGVFFGSTTGVPLSTGVFIVCLQSLSESKTLIEMCLDIRSVDLAEDEVDKTKPHFVEPTVPANTLLLCEVSKDCHIDIHFTNGDAVDFPGECPHFTDTSPEHFDGLHVFKSEYSDNGCTSDVAYIPSAVNVTHTFCIQLAFPGKKGENRCLHILSVSDLSQNVSHPCTGMSCDNNGKCIADFSIIPAKANCICPFGFDGEHCEYELISKGHIVGTETLEKKLDKGQHFDENSAVPNTTRCYGTSQCCLTVPYYGDKNKPPVLGLYDSSLDVEELTADTPDETIANRHIAEVCVKGNVGKYQLCLQTTTDGTKDGVVTDTHCFAIEISTGGEHQNQALPHFINSVSNGSRLLCKHDSNCQLSMLTGKSTDTSCQQVRECDGGVPASYVYPTIDVGDKCLTNIAVKTGELHHADEICLSAGSDGEKRVVTLESTCPLEFGHCGHSHCLNIGRCFTGETIQAVCVCDKQFNGASCDEVKVSKTLVTEDELAKARNSTIAGDGKCHCFVEEKESTKTEVMAVVQSAGYGAGGMASAMGIGGVIFGIIKKIKKPSVSQNKVTPRPKGKAVKADKKLKK